MLGTYDLGLVPEDVQEGREARKYIVYLPPTRVPISSLGPRCVLDGPNP